MSQANKIYFAGDFHLGIDGKEASHQREKRIIQWLHQIRADANKIYLLGDIFDFWFEYREVVPKGHFRLLAALDETVQGGTPVELITGNHDMWMFDYLEKEIGITIHRRPIEVSLNGKKFLIGHGDGLGPGDKKYKFIKKVFASPISQWLFARIHPNLGIGIAKVWSRRSRGANSEIQKFSGPNGEWLIYYCEEMLKKKQIDYFVFGHRHIPIEHTLSNGLSRYYNAGDWLHHYSFICFDGQSMHMEYFLDVDDTIRVANE